MSNGLTAALLATVLVCGACSSGSEEGDRSPAASSTTDPGAVVDTSAPAPAGYSSATALLEAASTAGLDVCASPEARTSGSYAVDALFCGGYDGPLVTGRIYSSSIDRTSDVATFRKAAIYDREDGATPTSLLLGDETTDGGTIWMIGAELDDLEAIQPALGGSIVDLS